MGLPIQYALTYPERKASEAERLDLTKAASLEFFAPDLPNTPCLALAMECARIGGTAPCVMSAANEEAVGLFLAEKIPFGKIYECVLSALESIDIIKSPTLDDILAHDALARSIVKKGNQ